MCIMYSDLIIENTRYCVRNAMLSTMEMMKYLIMAKTIDDAKTVGRSAIGRKLIINGGLQTQMEIFIFANT